MTKPIVKVKDLIEAALWYDGEVYPLLDDVDNVSYSRSGTRMGDYSGYTDWLKLISTYAYRNYTITLLPDTELTVVAPDVNNNIVVKYIDTTSTQTQIAAALQASDYITTATATNGAIAVTQDSDVGTLRIGKFFVKRKEGGITPNDAYDGEIYNIYCESDSEENVKIMINNIHKLTTTTGPFAFVWTSAGDPFWVRFFGGDDRKNESNTDFVIRVSGEARWMY